MNKTELESVVAFVQKINPEIVAISKGLKVRAKRIILGDGLGDCIEKNQVVEILHIDGSICIVGNWHSFSSMFGNLSDSFEILGRDITLEDVLFAYFDVDLRKSCGVNPKWYLSNEDPKMNAYWLPKIPLHLQSPETISFLHSLIKK